MGAGCFSIYATASIEKNSLGDSRQTWSDTDAESARKTEKR